MSTTPRRFVGLLALTASVVVAPLIALPANAAVDSTPHLGRVTGSAAPTPQGMSAAYSFVASNTSSRRTDAGRAYVSLVAVDREVGPRRSYRLDSVRVPALAPGVRVTLADSAVAPRATTSGDYHVRVCSTPKASDGTCRLSRRASVHIGDAALVVDHESIDFPGTGAGEASEPVELVVTNRGESRTNRLRLTLVGAEPEAFSLASGSCTTWLAAGESCTAQVAFTPAADATGTSEASVRVAGRGRGGVVKVGLSGVVPAESSITMAPTSWDYGPVPVGASATHTFELVNSGDADESFIDGQVEGTGFDFDYADGQNSCLSGVIPAHGSCTFSVAFAPQAAGTQTGGVTFSGDWGSASSALTGTGVDVGPVRQATRIPRSTTYGR